MTSKRRWDGHGCSSSLQSSLSFILDFCCMFRQSESSSSIHFHAVFHLYKGPRSPRKGTDRCVVKSSQVRFSWKSNHSNSLAKSFYRSTAPEIRRGVTLHASHRLICCHMHVECMSKPEQRHVLTDSVVRLQYRRPSVTQAFIKDDGLGHDSKLIRRIALTRVATLEGQRDGAQSG